jgi:hypothetical protein
MTSSTSINWWTCGALQPVHTATSVWVLILHLLLRHAGTVAVRCQGHMLTEWHGAQTHPCCLNCYFFCFFATVYSWISVSWMCMWCDSIAYVVSFPTKIDLDYFCYLFIRTLHLLLFCKFLFLSFLLNMDFRMWIPNLLLYARFWMIISSSFLAFCGICIPICQESYCCLFMLRGMMGTSCCSNICECRFRGYWKF